MQFYFVKNIETIIKSCLRIKQVQFQPDSISTIEGAIQSAKVSLCTLLLSLLSLLLPAFFNLPFYYRQRESATSTERELSSAQRSKVAFITRYSPVIHRKQTKL